ncbi:hypothetical protein FOG50_03467 [Hanseniaspora uvarum]|nr:hypothetical protein FOG50_03467 [Hanseniaspora uvarum]
MINTLNLPKSIGAALDQHSILSDIFPKSDISLPVLSQSLLSVQYGQHQASLGNTLPVNDTQELPQIQAILTENFFNNSSEDLQINDIDTEFTLILTDPDAPSRADKKWSEYLHYIGTGLKINATHPGNTDKFKIIDASHLKTLVDYQGPAPPKGTGVHRYVWLLFKGSLTREDVAGLSDNRVNWNYGEPATGVERFAKEKKLGPLVGINFFFAENKD